MGCCGWNEVDAIPTVPPGPVPADPRHLVGARRAEAEVALDAATAGRPLCRLDGAGPDTAKHAEGRWAALGELDRALRRSPTTPAADLAAELAERWRRDADRGAAMGPAWHAYYGGGADELHEVVRLLCAGSDRPSGPARP